jgi:Zn finger protein HypA/HybF involved in hydrogenase expression
MMSKTEEHLAESKFSIPDQVDSGVLVYEYGVRVDKDCDKVVWDQIQKARKLYNEIVATMRETYDEMNTFVLSRAGDEAKTLYKEIEALSVKFMAAKASEDKEGMKEIAQQRREKRFRLSAILKEVRAGLKAELKTYYDRIGERSTCATYQLRSKAVKDGLGWATANDVLTRAMIAWKTRIKKGQPPRFAKGEEKLSDVLSIQFTLAGGCPVETFFEGGHAGLILKATDGFGRRKYGSFEFRLGEAKANTWATGTIQLHRQIPAGYTIGKALLVRKRIGLDARYSLQLVANKPPEEIQIAQKQRQAKKYCAVHFGWAQTELGRHVMAIADQADPEAARIITVPLDVERDLTVAEDMTSMKSQRLNDIIEWIRKADSAFMGKNEEALEAWKAIRHLPTRNISASRLQRFCRLLISLDILVPGPLELWRRFDRDAVQTIAFKTRRARNRRKMHYRTVALELTTKYKAIIMEIPDLKAANTKVSLETGETSDMNRKSRYGQRVAALSEMKNLIQQLALRENCVLIELKGEKTVQTCGFCGKEGVKGDEEDAQVLHCPNCGAVSSRKQNGAAVAWQIARDRIDELMDEAKAYQIKLFDERKEKKTQKLEKRAEARTANFAKRKEAAEEGAGAEA